jgi:hypothetical protein
MMLRFGLLATVLSLAACQTVVAPPPPPAPVVAATINGVARYRTPEGRLLSCTGLSVILAADTPRARGRMLALYGSLDHAAAPVALVKSRSAGLAPPEPPVGSSQCDATGAFAFSGVNPGAYFLIAHARSSAAARGGEDVVILQRIVVQSGEARQVRLAP